MDSYLDSSGVHPHALQRHELLQTTRRRIQRWFEFSKPYLVLTKLWAGRGEQDDTDIISILRVMTPEDKAKTAELVRRHIGEDIEDFDQMIAISEM